MSRSRLTALIVLLVLAGYDFSFQPQRLVDSFQALRCCREHCQKSGPISAAERCCGVAADQAGLRAVHAHAVDVGAAATALLPGTIDQTPITAVEVVVTANAEPSRAPPLFLSNQSFLL